MTSHGRLGEPARPGAGRRRGRPSCRPRPPRRGVDPRGGARRCRPTGGTVSRWPARRTRRPRPRSVRATTLSPTRSTSSHGQSSSAASTASAIDLLVVADRRDAHQRGGQAEQAVGQVVTGPTASRPSVTSTPRGVPQDVVELRLVVALALGQAPQHEHARQVELAAGELPPTRGLDGHRPGRHVARGRARRRSRRRSPGSTG